MSREGYDLITGRALPEGQHDEREYVDCGCGYEYTGDHEEHEAYWAAMDGLPAPARHFHSEATPSGVIRTTRTDEAAERQRTVSAAVYVGDDDHAPPDVDRGGLRAAAYVDQDGYTWGDAVSAEADDARVMAEQADPATAQEPPPLNPKDAAQLRDRKPPLDLLERPANEAISWVMKHGADKYGRQNYLTIDIRARIYAAAVMRHAQQFLDGEDTDADSGLSHWAHIGANVHVFLAAEAAGKVIDDRGPAERTVQQEQNSTRSNAVGSATDLPTHRHG